MVFSTSSPTTSESHPQQVQSNLYMMRNFFKITVLMAICFIFIGVLQTGAADDCEKCGPTRMIGCRSGRCYYKCIRRCLGKDNKFYYEALKFNFAGQ